MHAIQLWRPALDTVYCMDALTLLRQMPEASVDAIITDPPYGVGTQVSARRSPENRFQEIAGANVVNTDWLRDAYRATKYHGALYCFAKWRNFNDWQVAIESVGYKVNNCIVWDKLQHGTGNLAGAYGPQHEFILFATKGPHLLRGNRPIDILRFKKVSPQDLAHPYEKPLPLIRFLIDKSSDEGALILDPFAGSGTTLVAARNLGRHYIGCDISPEYVDMARQRLALPYMQNMFERLEATP